MAAPYWRMSDSELVLWSNNFSTQLTATPVAYGITAAQAADYATLSAAFAAAVNTWRSNATRTPVASSNKKTARESLMAMAKYFVNSINSNPVTTDAQREQLGLPIRKKPTPNPVPSSAPIIDVVSVSGRIVTISLHATEASKRGKPTGVKGASLFTFVGDAAPSDQSRWKFEGLTTKTRLELDFESVLDSNIAWVTASWFNERGEAGVNCSPVSVPLPAGLIVPRNRSVRVAA